eukprot:jgi/Galph1/2652/GphlegSOOS_G1302.1
MFPVNIVKTQNMIYNPLGNSGILVSRLSFGSWVTFSEQIDADTAYLLMKRAYELGCNFFDNAENYASGEAEKIMGYAFQRGVDEGIWTREDLVFSTKIFFGAKGELDSVNSKGLSRKHIIEGIDASLQRMNIEYVDIVFCHRPDPLAPIEETVRAMNYVIEQGLAFYWGTSEWSAQEITEACRIASLYHLISPIAEQPQYNMFHRRRVEIEYLPLYRQYGLGTTTWSPLSWGILTGKYSGKNVPAGSRLSLEKYKFFHSKAFSERAWQLEKTDALKPLAQELGCTVAQLALAWCASNPNVSTVITGATKVEQVEENFHSIYVIPKLNSSYLRRIEEIIGTKPEPSAEIKAARKVRGLER